MNKLLFPFALMMVFFSNESFKDHALKQNGEREVDLRITYKVNVSGHINRLRLKMVIPADIKNRQIVNDLTFSVEPDSIYTANGNSYALFKLNDLDKDFKIVLKGKILIFNSISMKSDSSESGFGKYLVAESNIEVTSEKILTVAQTLKQKTDIETIIKTFEYVKEHISYQKNKAIGAEKVLETGVGKCMDYSDLFVALLRANNIPAKSMFGIVVSETAPNPLHAWPEAYLKKQGWVRFDPTTGHSDIIKDGDNYKMHISNKYVTLSEGRNDPELRASLYHYNYNYDVGGSVKIRTSFDIHGQ
ncbi:MAG: transglutaminase-like domain-containing protein [Ferruginibacter sp.]